MTRPHTSDDDLAFWLKNKGEFSEQPWLNFLLELRDCRAANAEALELVRRVAGVVEHAITRRAVSEWRPFVEAHDDLRAWIAAREAATPREETANE